MTYAELAVSLRDVHVSYTAYADRSRTWRAILQQGPRREKREIHAIRGVSIDFHKGETVGIVGTNGSGKSTMLRTMTGLIPPRSGQVLVRSRPTLLGVGAAFRPALSGRRNILIGGVALGLRYDEIVERADAIIEFSGIGDSIDLPMTSYSAGMRARLTFSVATCVTPEILLVDEALAVGDRAFKRRSLDRLAEIRDEAGLVILVSHNLQEMRRMDRIVWLEEGEVCADGSPDDVLPDYEAFTDNAA